MSQITPNESAAKASATPNEAAIEKNKTAIEKVEAIEKGNKVEKTKISLGEQFKQARQKLNLSIDEIATKINLRPAILQSIENNEFKNPTIPPAFMRGYVQSYAKFLRLPENIASAIEPASYGETKKNDLSKNTRSKKAIGSESSHSWVGCITFLIFLVAVAMTGLWWWENYQKSNLERDGLVESYTPAEENTSNIVPVSTSTPAASTESEKNAVAAEATKPVDASKPAESEKSATAVSIPVQQPIAAPEQPNTNAIQAPLVLKNLDAPAENVVAPAPAITTTSPATAAPVATQTTPPVPLTSKDALQSEMNKIDGNSTEATAVAPADAPNATAAENSQSVAAQDPAAANAVLRIEVTGPTCWISVKDGKRKLLAQQEYKQGEVLTFNAGDVYSLIIGAPGNVKITYQGSEVPLKVDGRVAKFKLPRQ